MAKFRGVPPSRKLERSYYLDMKRHFLDPYLANVSGRLAALGPRASVADWIKESEAITEDWTRRSGRIDEDYVDRKITDIVETPVQFAIDAEPDAPGPGGDFRKEMLGLIDEFIEHIEKAPPKDLRSNETLIEMLERKVREMTKREEVLRRLGNIARGTRDARSALQDKARDAALNYLTMWVSKYARWSRMIHEVYGIAFKGGQGTQTAKMLTEVLWDFRVKMDLWTAAISKMQWYMTKDGMRQLMVDMFDYYSKNAIADMEDMVNNFADRFRNKKMPLKGWLKAILYYKEYLLSGQWSDDLIDHITHHIRQYGERLKRLIEIARRLHSYTRQGGWVLLIDDLLQKYAMEWFTRWTTLKRYVNFDDPEIDLDLLYKDYLKPYLDRSVDEWDKWRSRFRFVDIPNREIDLDLLIRDIMTIYFADVWERWKNLERKWVILKGRYDNVGAVGLIEDAIDFAVNKLERRAAARAATMFYDVVEPFVMRWVDRLNRHTQIETAKDFIRVGKVDIRPRLKTANIAPALRQGAIDSVGLIKTIPKRLHDDLSRHLIQGETDAPLDLQARAKMFRRAGKSAGYNLRRITRDQSNKMTSRLARANQESIGVTRYRWMTSEDDRVRETHAAHNDRIFRWDQPPPDTGHPGEDIQCRCVATPVIGLETLRKRNERLKAKKRKRGKGDQPETDESGPVQLPHIQEVDEEAAQNADTDKYDIVPVQGEKGKYHLVPKSQALSTEVLEEEDDEDYGLSEEDFVEEEFDDDESETLDQFYQRLEEEAQEDLYEWGITNEDGEIMDIGEYQRRNREAAGDDVYMQIAIASGGGQQYVEGAIKQWGRDVVEKFLRASPEEQSAMLGVKGSAAAAKPQAGGASPPRSGRQTVQERVLSGSESEADILNIEAALELLDDDPDMENPDTRKEIEWIQARYDRGTIDLINKRRRANNEE